MPVSHHEGKDWLEQRYAEIRPSTVVDLGAGEGIYSMRFRPLYRSYWTAIEGFEPYVSRFDLASKYDRIHVADIRSAAFEPADLYVAGDVLEHLERPEALDVINRLQAVASHVFVSVPIVEICQGAVNGNPLEEHKHHWSFEDMHEVLDHCDSFRGSVIGAFHWRREGR